MSTPDRDKWCRDWQVEGLEKALDVANARILELESNLTPKRARENERLRYALDRWLFEYGDERVVDKHHAYYCLVKDLRKAIKGDTK